MKIASAIRSARHVANLTQDELAREVGVAPSTIAGWELGTRVPRLGRLQDLADALGTSVTVLLAGAR